MLKHCYGSKYDINLNPTTFEKNRNEQSWFKEKIVKKKEESDLRSQHSLRVYVKCLQSDLEYKTVRIQKDTTASDVICSILSKYNLKHLDSSLFYLSLKVDLGHGGRAEISILNRECLYELVSCNPWSGFCVRLSSWPSRCIKVFDKIMATAGCVYKSVRVSKGTTVNEVVHRLKGNCKGLILEMVYFVIIRPCGTSRIMNNQECFEEVVTYGDTEEFKFVLCMRNEFEENRPLSEEV